MTWTAALAVGITAVGTATQYQQAQATAKNGVVAADAQRQNLRLQASTTAIAAREQEVERQNRANAAQSSGRAFAAASGLDWSGSGSALALDAANSNTAANDMANIRLLGTAQQRQFALAGRTVDLQESTAKAVGANAWVQAGGSLLGAALQTYQTMPASTPSSGSLSKPLEPVQGGKKASVS